MPIPALLPLSVRFDLFSLLISHEKTHTNITMELFTPIVNTKDIPNAYFLIKKHLPSVLRSQCFNDLELPFSQEVRKTEIGHLFEHILLEYLCIQKMAIGCKSASYSGVTNWNWKKEKWGIFHITVSAGYKDMPIFSRALEKSVVLTQTVLRPQPLPLPSFTAHPALL